MYGVKKPLSKSDGGPVVGPGTTTSDSIKKEVPPGSFIMPTDSSARLGLNAEMIKQHKAQQAEHAPRLGVPGASKKAIVNLSNGEFELTPGQVHAVGVQVLNQAKDNTHTPQELPRLGVMRRAEATGKEQFFADGGLVMDPDKLPRLGVGNGAAARAKAGLTPQGVQGMAKDAASSPGFGVGVKPSNQAKPADLPGYGVINGALGAAKRVADFNLGTYKAAAGAVSTPVAYGLDKGRQLLAKATDSTLTPDQETYFQDRIGPSLIRAGLGQRHGAFDGLKDVVAGAIGATPGTARAGSGSELQASTPNPARNAGAGDTAPRLGIKGLNGAPTAMQVGNGIAMREGAGGVPEFTNDRGVVQSAQDLPRLGVGRMGNGIGTFSQAGAGDSQLAIDRFERANQEREGMIQASRRGQIGEGGGRVTVVADSSRAPSIADIMRDRQAGRQAQTEALRAQTQRGGAESSQRLLTEQLQQQQLQQRLATGQYALEDRQRIADLQARMIDSGLSESDRASARDAYTALTTSAKDRYIPQDVVMGQGNNGPVIGRQIIDTTTGKPVAADAGQTQRRSSVTRAEIEQAAKEDGVSVDDYISELRALGVTIG